MASSIIYQRKCALIIGINDYQSDPLKYCINDAEDLNTTLQRIGFNTTLKLNCNYSELNRTIDRFTETIGSNDLILFYFAGHGKQMEDQNYLLPADYEYDYRGYERDYIGDHAINVQYIMRKFDKTKCRITVYIFDCCRNLVRTRATNTNQGLLPMNAPSQTLIVYACAPGKAVLDETRNDRNGSFIENLLKHIETPNRDIEDIMKNVANDVNIETHGVQLPYRTSSLTKSVYLITNNNQSKDVFDYREGSK
jgi:uncharacterized caspase-like protein